MSFLAGPSSWNPRPAQDPFRDPVDPFADPLEDVEMTNFSSQSNAKRDDPNMHIMETIKNGQYICSICNNKVTGGTIRINYMWECRTCYTVTHHNCITNWSCEKRQKSNAQWPCPNSECTKSHHTLYKATCWCGRKDPTIYNLANPNTCGKDCKKRGVCSHERATICVRTCHPGLCDFICSESCPRTTPGPSTPWSRFARRWHTRERGTVTMLFWLLASIIVIDGLWVIGSIIKAKRVSMPYKYPGWNEGSIRSMAVAFGLVFSVVSTIVLLIIACSYSVAAFKTSEYLFNLNNPKKSSRSCIKFFLLIFLALLTLAAGGLPVVLYHSLGDAYWYNNMRDSCNGYETRIAMDRKIYQNRRSRRVYQASQYEIYNLNPTSQSEQDQMFALASRYDPIEGSDQPFQKYYRFSSTFDLSNGPWAIDVDLGAHVWRVLKLDRTDVANKWISRQYYSTVFANPPTVQPSNQTVIRNGTFTAINKKKTHMAIPSLGYVIADMYHFIASCYREPFLRVFKSDNASLDAAMTMADQEWSNKPNENIVMRTASFGHGRQRLSMCARNEAYKYPTSKYPDAMDKDLMVAFAIISSARMRIAETEERPLICTSH